MASRARRTTAGHPRRSLLLLLLMIAALFAGIAATTAWASPKGQWTPKLGLDLEGGRQIVLQPQINAGQSVNSGQVNQAVDIIRKRVDGTGVSEAEVTTLGSDQIVVSLPGNPSKEILDSLARSSQLTFRAVISTAQITNTAVQPTLPMPVTPAPSASASPSSSASPRSSAKPTASSSSTSSKANSAFPQAYSADDTKPKNASDTAWGTQPVSQLWITNGLATKGDTYNDLLQKLDCTNTNPRSGPTAQEWQEVAASAEKSQPSVGCDTQAGAKLLMGPVEVDGSTITDASSGPDVNSQGVATGAYAVNLSFNDKGTAAFKTVTTRLNGMTGAQNQFAIVVDGGIISAPATQAVITNGQTQITGNFTQSSAKTLADELKFGALPFSFKELTSDQISPQVGADQLQKGLIAGAIGMALVVLYSLLQYRALGLVTVASLVAAAAISYGAVTFLGYANNFRLTMAGVTGLIVAIGVTADSFIVYFERVRDEVRSGRPLRAAVETGWARAKRTIIISDGVNFLAAAVLYLLSESNVKGFAFTLGLTTLIDLLIVMLFTHPVLTLLARTKFFGDGHKWSGFDPERLGAQNITYAGRGRVTIADKRAAAEGGNL